MARSFIVHLFILRCLPIVLYSGIGHAHLGSGIRMSNWKPSAFRLDFKLWNCIRLSWIDREPRGIPAFWEKLKERPVKLKEACEAGRIPETRNQPRCCQIPLRSWVKWEERLGIRFVRWGHRASVWHLCFSGGEGEGKGLIGKWE
jgi:hypothetical protein